MDIFGKFADIFILVLILFLFPAGWALYQSEGIAKSHAKDILEDYMDRMENDGGIGEWEYRELTEKLSGVSENLSIDIWVRRKKEGLISLGEKLLGTGDFFGFNQRDEIILTINDREGMVYRTIRVYSW